MEQEKPPRRIPWGWLAAFAIIYLVTVMPVGLLLYNLKSEHNINIFTHGGFHTYLKCIAAATELSPAP